MSDWLVRLAPPLGRGYLRLMAATTRFRWEGLSGYEEVRAQGAVLMVGWHNRLLGATMPHSGQNRGVVISQSRDGELISRVAEGLGYTALRGSSSRGGSAALRGVLRHLRAGFDVGITPDGPRGPRYQVQPGAAFAALRSGVPVVPVGVGMSRKVVFSSWDRFQLPLPFGTIQLVYGQPLRFGSGDDPEAAGEAIRAAITEVTERADRLLGVTSP
ncbi:MAG: lysophospholipid acyltransferase family protein [Deltaproteobacteria bacterium]|nr:lysophospholipid acyltransferase family protein [Deltaproteobacteria bacterium]